METNMPETSAVDAGEPVRVVICDPAAVWELAINKPIPAAVVFTLPTVV
jgi:hypothetical protein